MTQRLYYTDSYLTDFTATVLERGDEGRRGVLIAPRSTQRRAASLMIWDRWAVSGCSMSSTKENA